MYPYQLKHDEEKVVDDKGPLASVPITSDTEQDGANRSEHEHEGDAPGDVRLSLAKLLGQVRNGQRNGEEVERIPRLQPTVSTPTSHCQQQGRHTQAAKAMKKNAHCCPLSMRSSLMGFGTCSMGGLRVEMRDETYSPGVMPSCGALVSYSW